MVNLTDIAARVKLATLSTSCWRATRLHRAETRVENTRHNTGEAARVLTRVCRHPALKQIASLHQQAYQEHIRLTLPSAQDTMRMLAAGREFEHAEKMRRFGEKHQVLTDSFLCDYPAERASAPARLNSLHDPAMWPSDGEIASKFGFATRYLGCPVTGEWVDWLAESVRLGEAELGGRLCDVLTRIADRCSASGRLYETVFSDLADLLSLVPDLDLSGRFAPVAAAAQGLGALKVDIVRDNDRVREQAANQANRIVEMLGGL